MSSRARSLLKRLRTKKQEEEGDNPIETKEETKTDNSLQLPVLRAQGKSSRSVPKDIKNKEEIDPLDYFKTEHIFIKESTMEEYGQSQIKKEIEEEKRKAAEAEAAKKPGVMFGVKNFNVNFEEMIRARSKLTGVDKKSLSVGTRNLKTQNVEKPKFEFIKKDTGNREDNLLIKLILAKNKYNIVNSQNLYLEILKRIDELKGYDLPEDLSKQLNNTIKDLELPKNLVLCQDVQVVSDDEDDTDTIGKKISLDQVINKMNIKSDL